MKRYEATPNVQKYGEDTLMGLGLSINQIYKILSMGIAPVSDVKGASGIDILYVVPIEVAEGTIGHDVKRVKKIVPRSFHEEVRIPTQEGDVGPLVSEEALFVKIENGNLVEKYPKDLFIVSEVQG
jgi:hypothetical protein